MAYGHGPMCRLCQPVDDTLDACLQNALDGLFEAQQDSLTGEFKFRATEEGNRRAARLIEEIADDAEDGEGR